MSLEQGTSSTSSQQGSFSQPGPISLPQPEGGQLGHTGAASVQGIRHLPGNGEGLRLCQEVGPWVDNRQDAARELFTGDPESSFHHEGGWMLAGLPRKAVKSPCLAVFKAQVKATSSKFKAGHAMGRGVEVEDFQEVLPNQTVQ